MASYRLSSAHALHLVVTKRTIINNKTGGMIFNILLGGYADNEERNSCIHDTIPLLRGVLNPGSYNCTLVDFISRFIILFALSFYSLNFYS